MILIMGCAFQVSAAEKSVGSLTDCDLSISCESNGVGIVFNTCLLYTSMGTFLGKRAGTKVWIAARIALAGMYLLCMAGGTSAVAAVGTGDAFMLGCAILFSVHILVVDYFSPRTDGVALSCIQFFTSGAICAVLAMMAETPSLSALIEGAVPVLYAGVLSCGCLLYTSRCV